MYPRGGEQCSKDRIVQRRAPSGRPSRSPVPSERPCKPSGRNVRQQSMRTYSERAHALKESATQSTPRNRLLWLAGLGLGCHGLWTGLLAAGSMAAPVPHTASHSLPNAPYAIVI